jgi:methylthioribose-1-phosphate isomerase
MKLAIAATALAYLAVHLNGFEVLDDIILLNETSLDNSTALELDAAFAECEDNAKNHGKFVSCATKVLKSMSEISKADRKAIKKAVAQSDIGKNAAEIIEDETGIDLAVDAAGLILSCEAGAKNYGQFKKCLNKSLNTLVKQGSMTRKEANAIKQAAKESDELEEEVDEEIEDGEEVVGGDE